MDKKETVFITGASAGVGRAIAREFARDGASIGLYARGRAGLEGAKEEVESLGGKALVLEGDVADWGRLDWAAGELENAFGPVDVWVNNAMVSVFSPFEKMRPEEFKRVTDVTYLGYVYGTMTALRRMRPRNRGKIVQVSSVLAHRSIPLQSAYCGAKHAINGFTESVRSELLHEKSDIDITEVVLPAVNTPQFDWSLDKLEREPQPVPPIYQPEIPARAVRWAASHRRRELTVGLRSELILWGNRFFPGLGDRYLGATGYESQMTDKPVDAGRPCNLWHPVDKDHDAGAHGRFDDQSRSWSCQLWFITHLGLAWLAAAAAGSAVLLFRLISGKKRDFFA